MTDKSVLEVQTRAEWREWLACNHERVERLIAAKHMHEAGLQKVAGSKLDGSWSKLDAVEALEVPADLKEALQSQPGAESNFAVFPRSTKRGILEWILQARRPETRQKRVTETAQLAARNERVNQWRK